MNDETPPFEPDAEYRYWAFISYSSKDKSWARWLQRAIESYGIPARLVDHPTPVGDPAPRRLRPLFRDRSELPAAADLGTQIETALRASRYLIVVCSPHATQSRWVDKEIATFRAMDRPGRVLAVVVDGEPGAGDERECLPPALRDTEPLAADARPEGDGKRDARLKLLAGMLGVGFDALKQRDTHRRIRRLQATIAAVLALAVGFAGLTAYAVAQRNTARQQRDKAVKARLQAEDLLSYLLYDLRDKLEPLGKLDIVANVQKQVDEYFQELGVEKDNPLTMWNRSVAFANEGQRLLAQGDLDGAKARYEAALKITERLVSLDPKNTVSQGNLAATHNGLARVLEAQGNLDGALEHYQADLEITTRLASLDPNNTGLQRDLRIGHACVAGVLQAQGDLDGALRNFKTSLSIDRRLVSLEPSTTDWQRDLAADHTYAGGILETQGDLDSASRHYQTALKIDQRLVSLDPSNTIWQRDLAACHRCVAGVLQAQGDLDGAWRQRQADLTISRRLVSQDPTNTDWLRDLAWSHSLMAGLLEQQGDPDGALQQYRSALEIDERLVSRDRTSTDWRFDLAASHENVGLMLEAQEDLAGALRQYRLAVKIEQSLVSSDPDNPQSKDALSQLRGDVKRVLKAQQRAP